MDPASLTSDFDAASFSGEVRVFPLPGVVLFPQVVVPLHIYEERYQELMQTALDGDRLIAMAMLKPGWEPDYEGRPPLETVACLGQITSHQQLADGSYNLMLAGVERIRLIEELEPPVAFRRYRAELLPSVEASANAANRELHERLVTVFKQMLPDGSPPGPLQKLFEASTPLGLLADLAAHTLPLSNELKLQALAEVDDVRRAKALVLALESMAGEMELLDGFPPSFSSN